jgi:Bacterial SH3 domain.
MAFKILSFIISFCLLPTAVWAQTSQRATVINDGAYVYKDADFDADIMMQLKAGGVYTISKGKKGPFYKIRIKQGVLGWIADSDMKVGVIKVAPPPKPLDLDKEILKKPVKPFETSRFRGIAVEMINYEEDTMGEYRNDQLLFYGIKWNGYNTMFSGDIYTDANLLFHFGAPKYYEELTGHPADGFIFMANFLLETVAPQGENMMFFYGFGPMFKYSHFTVAVDGAEQENFPADDMNLGAVFNIGMGFRPTESLSLRTDFKYHWEKNKYFGLGLNLGFAF